MDRKSNDLPRLEEIDGFRSPDGLHVMITAIRLPGSAENILREPLRFWGASAWWRSLEDIPPAVLASNWEPFSLEN